jgi:hypothetical protein
MADLDDIFAHIPTGDIATGLGVDEAEVNNAVQRLVPVLIGELHQNAQDPDHASTIESAAGDHAAKGLLDTGAGVDQVNQAGGQQAIAKIFGGDDVGRVSSALSSAGAGDSELLQKLLPIVAPIVLAYVGKQLGQKNAPAPGQQQASEGGLGDVLGSILGGMTDSRNKSSRNKSLGSALGNALGSKAGDILGGLLGRKK